MRKKTSFPVFSAFLNSSLHFQHFEKKGDLHRFCISEITGTENVAR